MNPKTKKTYKIAQSSGEAVAQDLTTPGEFSVSFPLEKLRKKSSSLRIQGDFYHLKVNKIFIVQVFSEVLFFVILLGEFLSIYACEFWDS